MSECKFAVEAFHAYIESIGLSRPAGTLGELKAFKAGAEWQRSLAQAELAALKAKAAVPDGMALVDKRSLGTVLQALVNSPHHIRELQATREPAALFKDNPINVLIENYEAAPTQPQSDGVIVPDRMVVPKPIWKDARHPYGDPLNAADIRGAEMFNLAIDEVLRLNSAAAPAQPAAPEMKHDPAL